MKSKYFIILSPIIFLIIWEIVALILNNFFLPTPNSIIIELFYLFKNDNLILDLFYTLLRFFIAIIISIMLGIPLGLLLGSNEKIYKSCQFIIDFFRAIPATAIFPLFLLFFGVKDLSKIGVAAFSSFIIILFTTSTAIRFINKNRILATKMMKANKLQIFKHVIFWESLPEIIIGIRTATNICLTIIIVTEMFIGTNLGLGKKIIDFQYIYNIEAMYAIILLTGIIGFLINLGFILFEKKVIHWSGK